MLSCCIAPIRRATGEPNMYTPNLDFEALKDITRLAWLLNFEALATVPAAGDAIARDAAH